MRDKRERQERRQRMRQLGRDRGRRQKTKKCIIGGKRGGERVERQSSEIE
jgi:hypothetical protein